MLFKRLLLLVCEAFIWKKKIFSRFLYCVHHIGALRILRACFSSHIFLLVCFVWYTEKELATHKPHKQHKQSHTHTRREYIQPEYFACACYYFANELTVFSSVWLMCFKNISMECVHSACAFALSLCSAFISSISIKMNFVKNHCNERLSGSFVNGWGALYENTPNKQINTHAYHSIFISLPWNNSLNSIKYDEPSAALTNFSYSKWSIIQLLYITPQGHGNYSVPSHLDWLPYHYSEMNNFTAEIWRSFLATMSIRIKNENGNDENWNYVAHENVHKAQGGCQRNRHF